jgi:uncharacterized membrane protein
MAQLLHLRRSMSQLDHAEEFRMVPSRRDSRVPCDAGCRGRLAAVGALSAVALAFWAIRASRVGSPRLPWFIWNLALAWIPWIAAHGVRGARGRWLLIVCGGLWLLFLPNAPYLVTDLVHLRERAPVPLWFDVLMFAAFALAGCALGWAAVEQVQDRIAEAVGRRRAALVILPVFPLLAFGVYLGRFGRWNSWDLLTRPHALLAGAVAAARDARALAFSTGFGSLIAAGYLLMLTTSARRAARVHSEAQPVRSGRTSPTSPAQNLD